MAKQFDHITPKLQRFIEKQPIFFVGTAAAEGRINVSPKGMDSLRVVDSNRVVWLNLTGSGNETAAHLLQDTRMTIMFCSFEKNPMILRLYGQARSYHPRDTVYQAQIDLFPKQTGARQIIDLQVDLVQTSCGFAVPLMDFKAERPTLHNWAETKGKEGIKAYWKEKNIRSLDGYETGISPEK